MDEHILNDYLESVYIPSPGFDDRVERNRLFQQEIRTRTFRWLPAILRNRPDLIDETSFHLLSEFLEFHSKARGGRKSKYTKSQTWDMCMDYRNYLSKGVRNSRELKAICRKHNVTETNLVTLYSRKKKEIDALDEAFKGAIDMIHKAPKL